MPEEMEISVIFMKLNIFVNGDGVWPNRAEEVFDQLSAGNSHKFQFMLEYRKSAIFVVKILISWFFYIINLVISVNQMT